MSLIASTLKARDVEETLDVYFYRPLGYWVARACVPLGVTPNAVTIASILIGAYAGRLFYFRDLGLNLLGCALWVVADTFDSADGQLARMTNHKSKLGRILDGFAGNLIFLSMYLHLFARMSETYDVAWGWLLGLVVLGGVSHSLQSSLADYYRNAYLKYVVDPSKSELEGADDVRREYAQVTWGGDPAKKFLLRIYLNYTHQQEALSRNFQRLRLLMASRYGKDIPAWFSEEYRRLNKPLMKYYAILTTNTRMFVMMFAVLADVVPVYFLTELIVINIVMVLVTLHQERLSAGLTAMVEARP